MHRLYGPDSRRRRALRLAALYGEQPPEVQVTREQQEAIEHEMRIYGTNHGEHELHLHQERLRVIWLRDLEQRRRAQLDRIPDHMVAQSGMLGALRATLFREPRIETIPPALAQHPDIVRTIIHGRHGWLIPTFQATLTRYADAENEEYIAACVTIGQPIVRDVRRLLDGALEQLLVHHILTVIRDGRIPIELLQRALIDDETGLIDFITQRDGPTMEGVANPIDLSNLATTVSRRYLLNIGGGASDAEFRDRYIASAQAEDARIRRVGAVVIQRVDAERGSRGEIFRLTDYRQESRYAMLTQEDIERLRPRLRGMPVEPILRVATALPTRPLREEVVELSQGEFNAMMRDTQCPICLCNGGEQPLTVACRHPSGSGTDTCRQAYHAECFESMKMSQGRYFHCSRCFVGRPNAITGVVIPFRLLFRVQPGLVAPALEARAMPAPAMAERQELAAAPPMAERQELAAAPAIPTLAERRALAAAAAERRHQEQQLQERDDPRDPRDVSQSKRRRGGKKRRKTIKTNYT